MSLQGRSRRSRGELACDHVACARQTPTAMAPSSSSRKDTARACLRRVEIRLFELGQPALLLAHVLAVYLPVASSPPAHTHAPHTCAASHLTRKQSRERCRGRGSSVDVAAVAEARGLRPEASRGAPRHGPSCLLTTGWPRSRCLCSRCLSARPAAGPALRAPRPALAADR